MTNMKLIYVCSPYRGNTTANIKAARQYCRQVYEQGYMPAAPHLYLPQFLNDDNPAEREAALKMGLRMIDKCAEVWAFGEKVSDGMQREIEYAEYTGKPVRYLPGIKTRKSRGFTPPSYEEVSAYVAERGNRIDARQFYDYYETENAKGEKWVDSKGAPVRNWKQKVITWETKGGHVSSKKSPSHFMNYNQRCYSAEELKHIGVNLLED